jgi:hypothetical protein
MVERERNPTSDILYTMIWSHTLVIKVGVGEDSVCTGKIFCAYNILPVGFKLR